MLLTDDNCSNFAIAVIVDLSFALSLCLSHSELLHLRSNLFLINDIAPALFILLRIDFLSLVKRQV